MIPHTIKYHVITVHYGEDSTTKKLVEQLLKIPAGPDRIIVVDHAQSRLVVPPSNRLEVMRPTQNSGYAGGVNTGLGLLAARGIDSNDIVVVMNNDVGLARDAFQVLRRWWDAQGELAVAGPQLRALNLFTGRSFTQLDSRRAMWQLPYLDGFFLTAPLQVFMHLQGLPNHLFLYWEDILFSLRARQVGLPLRVIPNLNLTHHSAKSRPASDDQLYYLVRNGALVLSRSIPYSWRLMWKVTNAARRIYHTLRPPTLTVRTVRQALRDAAHNRTGKRP